MLDSAFPEDGIVMKQANFPFLGTVDYSVGDSCLTASR